MRAFQLEDLGGGGTGEGRAANGSTGEALANVMVAVKSSPAKKADAPGSTVTTSPVLGALQVGSAAWLAQIHLHSPAPASTACSEASLTAAGGVRATPAR